MPYKCIKENLLMKSTVKADKTVLRGFADLAEQLGYQLPEISDLKQLPNVTIIEESNQSMPPLVTSGPGVPRKQRCGLPNAQAHEEDCKFAFINNLHNESQEQGEGITSFFVLRSKYFAFFGRPKRTGIGDPLSSGTATGRRGSSHNINLHIQAAFEHMEEDTSSSQDRIDEIDYMDIIQENVEQDRSERERLEQENLEREKLEKEKLERERLEREQQERLEQEKLEKEKLERERLEREWLEQERLKQEAMQQQLEWEQEQERLKQERLERERLEHEQEQARLKGERRKRDTQLDLERLIEQGRLE
jgi:flagellar biosynthesis GTPase FlhF